MRSWNDDPYTKKARKENYEARSIYKLQEIDAKDRIVRGARLILDLGAAPGSWTQYCLQQAPSASIVAVDLSPLNVTHPNVKFLQQSIEGLDLTPLVGERQVDLVLSDMAPKTSGIHERDVALSFELASLALDAAEKHLKAGGALVVKLFMGDTFDEFQARMKKLFTQVRVARPESTRKASREVFFVGKGFRR